MTTRDLDYGTHTLRVSYRDAAFEAVMVVRENFRRAGVLIDLRSDPALFAVRQDGPWIVLDRLGDAFKYRVRIHKKADRPAVIIDASRAWVVRWEKGARCTTGNHRPGSPAPSAAETTTVESSDEDTAA